MVAPVIAALPGLGSVVGAIFQGLDGLFTSTEEKEAAKLRVITEMQKPHIMQALTNLKEAEHPNWFVAGWRPAIGWVCALGLGYQFLLYPFASHLAFFMGFPADLPALDAAMLMTMTINLLGLGGLRTFEKFKGVARSSGTPPIPIPREEGIY